MRFLSERTKLTLALSASAVAIGLVLSGCAVSPASAPAGSASPSPAFTGPQLGAADLTADVKDITVLVVGDSLARAFGSGMSEVSGDRNVTIVNAAIGGCGIMLPSKMVSGDNLVGAENCNTWPAEWPKLVEEYKPEAVYLTTAFWETAPQIIDDSEDPKTFDDDDFRARYQQNVDDAIRILTAGGATVFTDNINQGGMHNQQVEAVERNRSAGLGVELINLYGEMCSDSECPEFVDGIQVLDETGHPAGESRDRLARFILNEMATAIAKANG
jgi:hypothetical protein